MPLFLLLLNGRRMVIIVVHYPRTGNSERAVGGKPPGERVAACAGIGRCRRRHRGRRGSRCRRRGGRGCGRRCRFRLRHFAGIGIVDRGVHQRFVSTDKCDLVPLLLRAGIIHVGQSAAGRKGFLADTRNAAGDRNGGKAAAIEGAGANALHPFRYHDAPKSGAAPKAAIRDGSYPRRESNFGKTGAVLEHLLPQAGDILGDRDARKTTAFLKCIIANAHQALRKRDIRQAVAVGEGFTSNACHIFRNCNVHKTVT